jgi:hypothetical protein
MQQLTPRLVHLIVPPVGDCTMPMLGPYVLAGYLRLHGIACDVQDASIELLRLVSSPEYLKALAVSESSQHIEPLLHVAALGAQAVGDCPDELFRTIAGLKLFSLLIKPPLNLSADNLDLPFDFSNIANLHRAVEVVEPITKILTGTGAFMRATAVDGAIIGMSVSFPSQLVLALSLAQEIRRRRPESTLVFGGSYFQSRIQGQEDLLDQFSCIDVIVTGHGEAVLLDLARGAAPWRVKGVVVRRGTRCVVDGPPVEPSSPDFSDVEWNRYVSGAQVAPYSFSTVCHYGRCRFCNGDRESSTNSKSGDCLDLKGMGEVVRRFDLDGIYIVDAAVTPANMWRIGDACHKSVKWAANARFEAALMDRALLRSVSDSGCYMLRFGLESGSQRILDAMRKGTHLKVASRVLKYCAEAGIRNHVYIMLGYPGEDESDRDATVDFLKAHAEYIYSYSISLFQALPNTPVYRELCDTLGLDPDHESEAVSAINAYIYPSEEAYAQLLECIGRITDTLALTSRSNQNCYSGRVFADCFIGKRKENLIAPVIIQDNAPDPSFWFGRFDTVVTIRPRAQKSNVRRSALIDLALDRVVSIEAGESEAEFEGLLGLAKEYCLHYDARTLIEALPASYEAEWLSLKAGQSHAIQYGPTLVGGADDRRD